MRARQPLGAALLGVALFACSRPWCPSASQQPTYGQHEVHASMRRYGCFGWCPSYEVRISRDGLVEYEGLGFVKIAGDATMHITRELLVALDNLFAQHGYLALDESYEDRDTTDLPTVVTSYRASGCRTKRVSHYLGDRDAPQQLTAIETGIDRIIDVGQWVGRTLDERREGWGPRWPATPLTPPDR
jgi:hypothetical protein